MKFDTALREYARQKILEIGPYELVVGIPTCNKADGSHDTTIRSAVAKLRTVPDPGPVGWARAVRELLG